ncbi:MAG: hypothetical protein GC131_00245 [Alphaproteobacteria bacterium]|nr:hypothetical protein [Alphaproteobacteria bacterium]
MQQIDLKAIDQFIEAFPPGIQLRDGMFEIEGVYFHFTREAVGEDTALCFTATLGYLPFTIESLSKRMELQAIFLAANLLERARFWIDTQQFLQVEYKVTTQQPADNEEILYQFLTFYQQAQPFLRLVGERL